MTPDVRSDFAPLSPARRASPEAPGATEAPEGTEAPEPADLTFEDERSPEPSPAPKYAAGSTLPRRVTPPAPGLPEAIAWCVAWFVTVQILLTVPIAIAGRAIWEGISGQALSAEATMNLALPPAMALGALLTLAVFRWRCGPLRKLGLAAPGWAPAGAACLSLPVVMIAGGHWGAVAGEAWAALCEAVPALRQMDSISSLTAVNRMLQTVPFPALILTIAVLPAIGEELLFRGFVGRGLIARWGLVRGVAITSVLFCLMHLHPAHVGALLPLAVFMHVAYLATRSVWVPIGLHFANNAGSLLLAKLLLARDALPDPHATEPVTVATVCLLVATTALAGLACVAVWSLRPRATDEGGREVTPRWPTVEPPPLGRRLRFMTRFEPILLGLWGVSVLPLSALITASMLAVGMGWAEM